MTREELEQAVIRDIINGATHWVAPEAVALSVIRLVVEACISKSAFFLAAMPVLAPSSAPPSSQRTRAMAEISEKQARGDIHVYTATTASRAYAVCDMCDAEGPLAWSGSDEATRLWNTRKQKEPTK